MSIVKFEVCKPSLDYAGDLYVNWVMTESNDDNFIERKKKTMSFKNHP